MLEKKSLFTSPNNGQKQIIIEPNQENVHQKIPPFESFAQTAEQENLLNLEEGLKSTNPNVIKNTLARSSMLFLPTIALLPCPDPSFFQVLLPYLDSEDETISELATTLTLNLFISFSITKENLLNQELLEKIISNTHSSDTFTCFLTLLQTYHDLIDGSVSNGLFDNIIAAANSDDACLFKAALDLLTFICSIIPVDDNILSTVYDITHQYITQYGPFTLPTLNFFSVIYDEILSQLLDSDDLGQLIRLCVEFDMITLDPALSLIENSIKPDNFGYFMENGILSTCHNILCFENLENHRSAPKVFDILATLSKMSFNVTHEIISEPLSTDIIKTKDLSFDFKVGSIHLFYSILDYISDPDIQTFLQNPELDILKHLFDFLSLDYDSNVNYILQIFSLLIEMHEKGECPIEEKLNEIIDDEMFIDAMEQIIDLPQTNSDEKAAVKFAHNILRMLHRE